ncbi:hypothetical protein M3Y94_00747000 [Aphelenchoides besseyi]|nr:hypothetical protein M3Y94_00747000 [Aphelenchoides besseyi]
MSSSALTLCQAVKCFGTFCNTTSNIWTSKKVDLMALKETLFFQVASESLKDEVLLNAMQTIEKLSVTVTYQNRKELIELIKTIKSMMPNVKILNVDVKVYEHISHPNISNKLTRLIGSVLDFASQLGFNETYVNCTGELEFVDLGTRQLTVPQIWNSVIQTSFKEMKSTTTSTCLMNSRGDIICNGEYLTAEMESSNYKMKTELSVLHDSADDNSDDDFDLNYDDN